MTELEYQVATAVLNERERCAAISANYPLVGFVYDTRSHGDVLRLRDTISEAILKNVPQGEMVR